MIKSKDLKRRTCHKLFETPLKLHGNLDFDVSGLMCSASFGMIGRIKIRKLQLWEVFTETQP
jgi:hypothetical protein